MIKLFQAGSLTTNYENGFLRYIRIGKVELIRMIYFAVRDQDWNTIPFQIYDEKISYNENSFKISYDAIYNYNGIEAKFGILIAGSERSEISFELKGETQSTFKKNRIGICILHPIKECAGYNCIVTDHSGKKSKSKFPFQISPHQPFTNIKSITWGFEHGVEANINFEGEVFEMEDQRNWTDTSFKTYSTPLSIPFPVEIPSGTKIAQEIKLKVTGDSFNLKMAENLKLSIDPSLEPVFRLPAFGTILNLDIELKTEEIKLLKELGFNHFRIDLYLEKDWRKELNRAIDLIHQLESKLELTLFFKDYQEIENVIPTLIKIQNDIFSISIFSLLAKATPDTLLQKVLPSFKEHLPGIKIGAGTDNNFAELNRNRHGNEDLHYISYSINPQVHAFDDQTLVENIQAQYDTVKCVRSFSEKPVHISAVTLKPRRNAVATSDKTQIPMPDIRQTTAFCASWTLGSIKYLAEAGVESVTYFLSHGKGGLLEEKEKYPIYSLFYILKSFSGAEVIKSDSNNPLVYTSLVLRKKEETLLFLANHQNYAVQIEVDERLEAVTSIYSNSNPLLNTGYISLLPYEVVCFKIL